MNFRLLPVFYLPWLVLLSLFWSIPLASSSSQSSSSQSHNTTSTIVLPRIYPQRHQDEAAVIEWGHSAIISALDAVVADFGPQTSHAALLEVETTPVLAIPLNGLNLQNGEDMFGNVAIVLDTDLTGYELALLFQSHGAAAVIVVHVNTNHPDEAPRLYAPTTSSSTSTTTTTTIDIPVVSISWTAATVLTTALLPEDDRQQQQQRGFSSNTLSAEGLPERIRLYAGEDRPFFEDMEAANPTVYLIHNLLTSSEADQLIATMDPLVSPIVQEDSLQYSDDIAYLKRSRTERAVQWQGLLATLWLPQQKAIIDRIDQVTGFPAIHMSDFIVDKISSGQWERHYDSILRAYVPLASITIFLNDHDQAIWKFPLTKGSSSSTTSTSHNDNNNVGGGGGNEIHIRPRKGLAIVHHNTDAETQRFDPYAVHALDMNGSRIPLYVARKIILPIPPSIGQRLVLPIMALINGGKLPIRFSYWYEVLLEQYGPEDGPKYFDYALVIVPSVLVLIVIQVIVVLVLMRRRWFTTTTTTTAASAPLSSSIPNGTTMKNRKNNGKEQKSKKD